MRRQVHQMLAEALSIPSAQLLDTAHRQMLCIHIDVRPALYTSLFCNSFRACALLVSLKNFMQAYRP